MSREYEAGIVDIFGKILKEGYIYRAKKPIYWCPNCVTALAEAEVEYESHTSSAIFVKFKVDPASIGVDEIDKKKAYIVIWTTTPWTLPANLAVCFHPEFQYSLFRFKDEFYILAKGLVQQMESVLGMEHQGEWPLDPAQIEALRVAHPFIDRDSKVVFGDHVTLDQGTGIVHTAPGHGQEDYQVGLRYGLDVFCPVDDNGRFTDDFAMMKGVNVFDANEKVIELLKKSGALISSSKIEHSYPHCWRCKKPLIFRATEQWFFSIDHNDLRKKGLASVDDTQWVPAWGESRFRGMAETRPDWCLSRQRSWGVPIPSFRCESCGKNLMTADTVQHFADLSRAGSIDLWYTEDIRKLVPAGTKCSCGSESFIKEFDILDVWFDSGVSHFVVLDKREGHQWPADAYLEGSDQHRGWFQSSLWPALALKGRAPFKTVITHGFILDDAGKAMSKSLGNVIPPEKLISQFGADILRLWVSSEDYRNDVRIGIEMIKQIADSYRKIRNTFKFLLGNITDYSKQDALPYGELSDIDKWILNKLYVLSRRVMEHYEKYEFHMVYRRIVNFCAVELSSIYFDISKDILYVEARSSKKRRANLMVLNEINECLVRLVSPVLSFTAEEIWKFMGRGDSVHMQTYYELDERFNNADVDARMEQVVNIKKDALKALEVLRRDGSIKTSQEADLLIYTADTKVGDLCRAMGDDFRRFLQVAKASMVEQKDGFMLDYESCSIAGSRTTGKKCVRCWNYYESLGPDAEHPELCERCTGVVKSL
jgi:isoleucyl-tRNA synthetase